MDCIVLYGVVYVFRKQYFEKFTFAHCHFYCTYYWKEFSCAKWKWKKRYEPVDFCCVYVKWWYQEQNSECLFGCLRCSNEHWHSFDIHYIDFFLAGYGVLTVYKVNVRREICQLNKSSSVHNTHEKLNHSRSTTMRGMCISAMLFIRKIHDIIYYGNG